MVVYEYNKSKYWIIKQSCSVSDYPQWTRSNISPEAYNKNAEHIKNKPNTIALKYNVNIILSSAKDAIDKIYINI